ncbi:MAG: hypothetical protein WED33_07865 [Bacteroidia bacterium]
MNVKGGFTAFLIIFSLAYLSAQPAYISKAIAGNDHQRKKPLTEALENGFAGITADLNLKKNGNLYSGSDLFKDIYLEKAKKLVQERKGNLYQGRTEEFIMVLELLSDEKETLEALEKELSSFVEILSSKSSGGIEKKAIRLVVSGKNGSALGYISPSPYIFTEVPFNKTTPGDASAFIGTTSMRFKKVYDWNGSGSMPNMQYHSFSSMIKVAQKSGRKVRLFDIPEIPNAFDLFINAGADYIQVDDIDKFVTYWRNRKPY